MLTLQEIHTRLKERFGDAIAPWESPQAGDAHIGVAGSVLAQVCRYLRDDSELRFDMLRLVSAVEWPDRFSSVYHLLSIEHRHEAVLRVDLDREQPRVASVAGIWPAADWHEREAYDLMGIVYEGHPDLRRILLPEDWEGHPLRKDYQQPESYHGIPNE